MAVDTFFKLLPRAFEPYHVIITTCNTVKLDQDGITDSISSVHASLAPTSMHCDDKMVNDEHEP